MKQLIIRTQDGTELTQAEAMNMVIQDVRVTDETVILVVTEQ